MTQSQNKLIIHTDGAARGNPGPAGIGVVIADGQGAVLREFGQTIGEATNNVAEYTALIRGLEAAVAFSADTIEVYLDSELVVKQLSGEYKVKNQGLKGLHAAALGHLGRYRQVRVAHIPRAQNKAADSLANDALDGNIANEEGSTESALPDQGSLF